MGSWVGVPMGGCPSVEMGGQVSREPAARREGGFAHEDDRHAGFVSAQALLDDDGVVPEILGHHKATLLNRPREHVIVAHAAQGDLMD